MPVEARERLRDVRLPERLKRSVLGRAKGEVPSSLLRRSATAMVPSQLTRATRERAAVGEARADPMGSAGLRAAAGGEHATGVGIPS